MGCFCLFLCKIHLLSAEEYSILISLCCLANRGRNRYFLTIIYKYLPKTSNNGDVLDKFADAEVHIL